MSIPHSSAVAYVNPWECSDDSWNLYFFKSMDYKDSEKVWFLFFLIIISVTFNALKMTTLNRLFFTKIVSYVKKISPYVY